MKLFALLIQPRYLVWLACSLLLLVMCAKLPFLINSRFYCAANHQRKVFCGWEQNFVICLHNRTHWLWGCVSYWRSVDSASERRGTSITHTPWPRCSTLMVTNKLMIPQRVTKLMTQRIPLSKRLSCWRHFWSRKISIFRILWIWQTLSKENIHPHIQSLLLLLTGYQEAQLQKLFNTSTGWRSIFLEQALAKSFRRNGLTQVDFASD